MDEAHLLRNVDGTLFATLRQIKGDFTILSTGTLTVAGVDDIMAYLRLLQPINAERYYAPGHLRSLGFDPEEFDPFKLPDSDNCADILRQNSYAYDHFVRGKPAEEQGVLLRKMLKGWVIRRTYSSKVPRDSKVSIAASLPRYSTVALETQHSAQHQPIVDGLLKVIGKKLCFIDENTGRRKWSFAALRRLILVSDWAYFDIVHDYLMTEDVAKALDDNELLRGMLAMAQSVYDEVEVPAEDDKLAILAQFIEAGPKLRIFCYDLAEIVVKEKNNVVVWVHTPAMQAVLGQICKTVNVEALVFHSKLTSRARSEMLDKFTRTPNASLVLIVSYALASVGLNFQGSCCNVWHFDPASDDAQKLQARSCVVRLHNPYNQVFIREYYVKRTFSDRIARNNFRKAFPGLLAELDGGRAGQMDLDEEGNFKFEPWCYLEGRLLKASHPKCQGLNLKPIPVAEFIRFILDANTTTVTISGAD
ncbi:hypothetical protein MMC10_004051 [Thelotrema lepadinum]|nr:hypothetical protein [Thelotrema lepadinum]